MKARSSRRESEIEKGGKRVRRKVRTRERWKLREKRERVEERDI